LDFSLLQTNAPEIPPNRGHIKKGKVIIWAIKGIKDRDRNALCVAGTIQSIKYEGKTENIKYIAKTVKCTEM